MIKPTIIALAFCLATLSAGAQQPDSTSVLTFRLGPADAPQAVKTVIPFQKTVYDNAVKSDAGTVAISRIPPTVTAHALYGYNFMFGGKNCGWILDGDDEHGWRLYLDWKGNGDLSETKPVSFTRIRGAWALDLDVPEGDRHWPCRFEVMRLDAGGSRKTAVKIGDTTVRRGVIVIGGQRAKFAVRGEQGRYNVGDYRISVDRGDGEFESFKRSEGYINLFGKSYSFSVDPGGDTLTLKDLGELRPDRPTLRVGSAAPEFSHLDIDGVDQSIAKHRGHMLLVEFWTTSCGPCREEMPQMVRFFNETAHESVAYLGVSADASESDLRAFTKEFRIPWPQIRDASSAGPLHRQYRVNGWPTYFLVGRAGEILDSWQGSGETETHLRKFLPSR